MSSTIMKTVRCAMFVLFCGFFAINAASGSGGGSGDGGGQGGTDTGPVSYDVGKKLFLETVVCDTCPYADLTLDSAHVRDEWKSIKRSLKKKGEIGRNMKWSERESVKRFIKKRFIKADNSGIS